MPPAAEPVEYPYGEHPSQFVRLHLPPYGEALPVALVIHGGFWRERYGVELADPLCRDLTEHGIAAAAVEYRRVGRPYSDADRGSVADPAGGGWPTTLIDVARAADSLDTLAQLRARQRLDCSRVVAVGHSAGGMLAAWLAHRTGLRPGTPGSVRPGDHFQPLLGAVCQAPVLDMAAAADARTGDTAVIDLLGGSPRSVEQRYRHASPSSYVGDGTALALVHGDADDEVPIDQSRTYLAAARSAGDPVRLRELPGTGHYELIDPEHAAWRVCRAEAMALLGR